MSNPGADPLRVMFFTTDVSRQSGASYAMKETIRRVARLGARATVVLPDSPEARAMFPAEEFDARFIPIARPRRKLGLKVQVSFLAGILPLVWKLRKIIREDGIRLVHTNEITDFLGNLAARLCGVKVICHVRADGFRPTLQCLLLRVLAMTADRIVVPSASTKAWMVDGYPRLEPNIVLVHDSAFNLDDYRPDTDGAAIRRELRISEEERVVVLVSKLTVEKGHLRFIHAAELASRRITNLRFVIVGGPVDGHDEEAAQIRAAAARSGARVELVGQRRDLAACIAAADLVVHCPVYPDTFPTVVLLGMAMGKTVIGSRIGGIPEQIEHGETGFLVPPDDPHALASAIEDLLRDSTRRVAIGQRARAQILKEYSPEGQGAEVMQVYRSLIPAA